MKKSLAISVLLIILVSIFGIFKIKSHESVKKYSPKTYSSIVVVKRKNFTNRKPIKSENQENFTRASYTKSRLDSYFQKQRAKTQSFSMNSNHDTTFITSKGCKLYIPKYTFVDQNQRVHKGNVKLLCREIFSLSEIISENVSTLSDSFLLSTGGMFHISALTESGDTLNIRRGKRMVIKIPTQDSVNSMSTFQGKNLNGIIHWELKPGPSLFKNKLDKASAPIAVSYGNIFKVTEYGKKMDSEIDFSEEYLNYLGVDGRQLQSNIVLHALQSNNIPFRIETFYILNLKHKPGSDTLRYSVSFIAAGSLCERVLEMNLSQRSYLTCNQAIDSAVYINKSKPIFSFQLMGIKRESIKIKLSTAQKDSQYVIFPDFVGYINCDRYLNKQNTFSFNASKNLINLGITYAWIIIPEVNAISPTYSIQLNTRLPLDQEIIFLGIKEDIKTGGLVYCMERITEKTNYSEISFKAIESEKKLTEIFSEIPWNL